MDEAEAFARDRRRYRLHAATFLIGIVGLTATAASSGFLMPMARVALLVGFSTVLTISGVLAVLVKRTMFSKLPSESHTDSDGDALFPEGFESSDLSRRANDILAPYAVLATGIGALVASVLSLRLG